MSIHISAKQGEIAEVVLLPGDPLRAKYIAENFLEGAKCYNEVRGMYGYTGSYKGKKISVQGTGMGQPSAGIYINELISSYQVKKLIRIGSCGSIQKYVHIRDIIVAIGASSDSNMNKERFLGYDYAPIASPELLFASHSYIEKRDISCYYGNVFSTDTFYSDDPENWKKWADFNVLAVEMETAQLYTLAAKFKVQALSILTVSDSLVTKEETSSEEREKTFNDMIELALHIC